MTLQDIPIDPKGHGFVSADILLAGNLTKLWDYAKYLEEELNIQTTLLAYRIAELEKEVLLLEKCQKHVA